MMGLSGVHLLIFGFIILLLFGNRLPGAMRSLGMSLTEFKKGVQGIEDENAPKKSEAAQNSEEPKSSTPT